MSLSAPVAGQQAAPAATDWMTHLRQEKVRKVFLGEHHNLRGNMEVAADFIGGAAFGGYVQYRRELRYDDNTDEAYVRALIKKGEKTDELISLFFGSVLCPQSTLGEAVAYVNALNHGNVTLKEILFAWERRRDLPNFIKSKKFAIAHVGLAHVAGALTAQSTIRCWSGFTGPSVYTKLSFAAQNAMYGGLEQARMANVKAVAMQPSYIVETDANLLFPRKETYRGANARGFVVLELPLDRPYNMTVFADQSLIPVLASFNGWTRRPQWFCGPIEGCPADYLHDEL